MNNSKVFPDIFQETRIESFAALFYIFLNDEYLGWDCFTKGKVSIGSGEDADLILEDEKISNIHALFHFKDGKIIISDETNGDSVGVYVNSCIVTTCELGPFDYVRIGDYTIKVKTKFQKNVKDLKKKKPALEDESEGNEKPEESGPEIKEENEAIEAVSLIYEDEGEDEDDDDDDDEALFLLKDKLIKENRLKGKNSTGRKAIEIIKWKENSILDVCFLFKKEKYFAGDGNGKFCLAENNSSGGLFFYFNDRFKGKVRSNGAYRDTDSLCEEKNLYQKKNRIYRVMIPENGGVALNDGYFNYLLRKVDKLPSPLIPDPPKEKNVLFKNFVRSTVFHFLAFLFAGLFSLTHTSRTVKPLLEDRFVRIEMPEAHPLKKVKQPVIKKIRPVVKKKKKAAEIKKRKKKKAVASLPPKGGGGKKGNVKNKNINQIGILSVLGLAEGIGLQPSEALAAVTNLDAVVSSNAVEGNFKVGGVVAKLDTPGISIPMSEILTTKGSAQVLRSGGGDGRLAALNSGSAGQGKVRGAVSARLNKTVRIRGGMSREAVKRVIDEHMEEISYCYEIELIANPSLMGKIVFEWKILLSGSVGEVRTKFSSINDGNINSCISNAIRSWQFPEPKGSEVVVSYPFIFDIVEF